ncbi:MAG: glycosyltransferase family protein [Longimicrobiales bacterium]|nr:glycosyltransferase family protein [Longimicrobiales bacterium]
MAGLRVAFVVQGEGRGHMTQALALASFLRDAGHEVVDVLVGRSPHRSTPAYFLEEIEAPVHTFEAPVQVPGPKGRRLSVRRTVSDAVRRSPAFLRSVVAIAERTVKVDVVVSFLDLLGGVSRVLFPNDVPTVAIAHNYVFLHPALADVPGPPHRRRLVLGYARATTAGTEQRVALSFDDLDPVPEKSLLVAPPLLRPGLDDVQTTDEGYLLAYTLNPGYADLLAAWQRGSGSDVHCYLEGGASSLSGEPNPGFHAHDLDGKAFLDHLAGCRAYVGSAGFESICEAHYLGKPVKHGLFWPDRKIRLFDRRHAVRGFFFGNEPPDFPNRVYIRQGDPRQLGVSFDTRF